MFLEIKGIKKHYGEGESRVEVLNGIDIEVNKGEIVVLLGPSGSGKSTLLNIIGGIDDADEGYISIDGEKTADMNEKRLTQYRRKHLGYVFQMYNLIPNLTVRENIEVGAYLSDKALNTDEILNTLGLSDHADKKPNQLSGGQQQRTSIGRALIKNPDILLCDEPTGALDYNTSKDILKLIEDVNKKYGNTIIIVTHQMEVVKEVCNKVAILKDGKVLECGDTEELFLNHSECLKELLGEEEVVPNSGVNIKLFFPKEFSNGYIITSMARSLDIDFSIVWGKLEKFRDDVLGSLIINIPQDKKEQVINYLNSTDIKWEVLQNKENKINNKEFKG